MHPNPITMMQRNGIDRLWLFPYEWGRSCNPTLQAGLRPPEG